MHKGYLEPDPDDDDLWFPEWVYTALRYLIPIILALSLLDCTQVSSRRAVMLRELSQETEDPRDKVEAVEVEGDPLRGVWVRCVSASS